MTLGEAVRILREHNEWRRGSESIPQGDPLVIGEAIDFVCATLEDFASGKVAFTNDSE